MPTFQVTGNRQQRVTQTLVMDSDDEQLAIRTFKERNPGVSGVKVKRVKDVVIIASTPAATAPKKTAKGK